MSLQVIEKNGQIEWAVIPYTEYKQLKQAQEMLADIEAYDTAKAAIAAGEGLVPRNVVDALLEGEQPLRVWRRYRGFSQQQLAQQTGISKAYLSQLESGKRGGSTDILKKLAAVLNIDVDDLLGAD